jgi:hypothetical protein
MLRWIERICHKRLHAVGALLEAMQRVRESDMSSTGRSGELLRLLRLLAE